MPTLTKDFSAYITIAPRGLERFTSNIIRKEIQSKGYECINVTILDSLYKHHVSNDCSSSTVAAAAAVDCFLDESKVDQYKTKLLEQQQKRKERLERKQKKKGTIITTNDEQGAIMRSIGFSSSSNLSDSQIHGSLHINENGHEREINIGFQYNDHNNNHETIVSSPGGLEGKCIIQFETNAPPPFISNIRPMGCGPLLALILTSSSRSSKSSSDSSTMTTTVFDKTKALDDSVEAFTNYMNKVGSTKYNNEFEKAIELWYRHAKEVWFESNHVREHQEACNKAKNNSVNETSTPSSSSSSSIDYIRKLQQSLEEKMNGDETCYYRVSCMRSYTKEFLYKRDDIIPHLVKQLIPKQHVETNNTTFSKSEKELRKPLKLAVNLKKCDFELVIFIHDDIITIAISLRPYQYLGARSYSSGKIPPDISQPYIAGEISKTVIRLRPSIASLLCRMSQIKKGDIVLDPCGGIGSVPIEASLLNNSSKSSFGIGGDIAIGGKGAEGFETIITNYCNKAQKYRRDQSCSGGCDVMAWDASCIPLRDCCVDCIISDLPFGVKCMSSTRLQTFLPLLFSECARVLRTSGTMTLLCGASYKYVLDALSAQQQSDKEGLSSISKQLFRVDSIFPVNIGGLSGWIIQARRNDVVAVTIKNYKARLLNIVASRDQQQRQGVKRRLQS